MKDADFDVVIAGGGMVGAGLAALIATEPKLAGLRVALAEPRSSTTRTSSAPLDLRVSALSRASEQLLRQVGAWGLLAHAPSPYERIQIWDAAGRADPGACLVLTAARLGEPNLGHIVENLSITAALAGVALARGVTMLPHAVTALELEPDAARFESGSSKLRARLLVAADGADSPLRRAAGLKGSGASYAQSAIVSHLAPAQPHAATAYQRFLPGGPLALLPLADGRVSLVWSMPAEEAAPKLALDEDAFGRAVSEASDHVLGALTPAAPRAAFPLHRFHASGYCAPRLALVGDAAHTVHPLAGQGVNLGFLDALELTATLARARKHGEDFGDVRVLGRYSRARRADNALMLAACDGLNRLFGTQAPGVPALRRLGLSLVGAAPLIQRALMLHALGIRGQPLSLGLLRQA